MGSQTFTTSDSFTVPAAVKLIDLLEVIGGGGGGGTGVSDAYGGQAGGYLTKANITVSPGSVISFVVGAGGTVETVGSDTNYNSGEFICYGGNGASGNLSVGSGAGTTGGSGTPTSTTNGASGGSGFYTSSITCSDCTSYCCDGDCTSTCYNCNSTGSSDCYATGAGGSGWDSPGNAGSAGSGGADGTDNCGYPTGVSCTPAYATGGQGAGGNGNEAGTAGGVRFTWTNGHFAIGQNPTNTVINTTISPAITVIAQFSDNSTDTSFTGNVTMTIWSNPSGGILSGTTTVAAVAGVATFSDLSIDAAGVGYQLYAYDPLGSIDLQITSTFNITAPPVIQPPRPKLGSNLAPRFFNRTPKLKV